VQIFFNKYASWSFEAVGMNCNILDYTLSWTIPQSISVFCVFLKGHICSYVQSWNVVTAISKHFGRMFCWNHVKYKASIEPQAALASALYYASEEERETMHCFLLFHEMRELLRKQNSVVHLLLYGQEPHFKWGLEALETKMPLAGMFFK